MHPCAHEAACGQGCETDALELGCQVVLVTCALHILVHVEQCRHSKARLYLRAQAHTFTTAGVHACTPVHNVHQHHHAHTHTLVHSHARSHLCTMSISTTMPSYTHTHANSHARSHLCTMSISTTMPSRWASSMRAFKSSGVPNLSTQERWPTQNRT